MQSPGVNAVAFFCDEPDVVMLSRYCGEPL
jgi:hypothetical protein